MAVYVAVRDEPFKRVPEIPTKKDRDHLYEEVCNATTSVNGGYDWAGEFELLAITTVGNKYTGITTKVYVDPIEPPAYNAHINKSTSDYPRDKKSAEH